MDLKPLKRLNILQNFFDTNYHDSMVLAGIGVDHDDLCTVGSNIQSPASGKLLL